MINEYGKKYYSKNKDEVLRRATIHRKNNIEKERILKRKYRKQNHEAINANRRLYIKEKKLNDPEFVLRANVSRSVRHALTKRGKSKNGNSMLKFLPYSINELKAHIESKFESLMNLSNYGRVNSEKMTWQIDHIIPQSKLRYDSMEDKNFQKCWALNNLRPLESFANLKKSNKVG